MFFSGGQQQCAFGFVLSVGVGVVVGGFSSNTRQTRIARCIEAPKATTPTRIDLEDDEDTDGHLVRLLRLVVAPVELSEDSKIDRPKTWASEANPPTRGPSWYCCCYYYKTWKVSWTTTWESAIVCDDRESSRVDDSMPWEGTVLGSWQDKREDEKYYVPIDPS